MIIDVHTHIGKAEGRLWTPDDLLDSMKESGVDYSIILAEGPAAGKQSEIENIIKVSNKNANLKAVVNCHYETLDIQQINSIIDILEKNQAVGVKFYLGYEHYYPYNEKLFPIYEYCQTNKKPVMLHTGILEANTRGLLKYSHPLNIDELAYLFPDLRIIMAHMGNPWLLDCAAVMSKNRNVYADTSGFFDESTPIEHSDIEVFIKIMENAKLFLGSYEKFLFGTDWPLYNQKQYIEAVKALNLTEKESELVFWKNAVDLFNLKVNNKN